MYGTSPSPITEESPVGHVRACDAARWHWPSAYPAVQPPCLQGITNPYGQTKFMIEQVLQDVAKAPTPPAPGLGVLPSCATSTLWVPTPAV